MGDFSIKVEAGEVLGFMDSMAKHAPNAIALAINRTVDDGYAVIRQHVREAFTIRTLPLAFVAPMTNKPGDRATPQRLYSVLEPAGAGKILSPFEEGIPHGRDRLGRPVIIPSSSLRPGRYSTIPRNLYPTNLGLAVVQDAKASVLYYNTGRGAKKRGITGKPPQKGRQGTFTATDSQGRTLYIQRTSKDTTRVLWFTRDSVPRPPILEYRDAVQRTVDQRWEINMRGAWDYYEAIASRRAER